jgi:uncharacterized glyoxalase superfamily protein PhnB
MSQAKTAPSDYHAVTLVFNVKGADEFIMFCTEALGAEERMRRPGPNNSVMHADVKLGDTIVWVSDAIKDPPTSAAIVYSVPDCDATFERAVRLGANPVFPPSNPPWGGRWARVEDRWGNSWTFTTRPEEK